MSRLPLVKTSAPWIVAGALWLWVFFHLQVEWSLNPQYNYGWAVPFLALLIFWFRWRCRPEPYARSQDQAICRWTACAVLLLLLPIRVIEEANPDWRLLSWILALCVVGF